MIFETKYGQIEVYAKTIEQDAISQLIRMANSPLGENAHIRIMPDCHAGAGCVVGTTMVISDKVCPNLVGVDIGCGVDLVKTDIDFASDFARLDKTIRLKVPFGLSVHDWEKKWDFERLLCYDALSSDARIRASRSLGTLGGGNHFIEAYDGGWLAVHSGSRNIGYQVADYYQKLAEKRLKDAQRHDRKTELEAIPPAEREAWHKGQRQFVSADLAYLTGSDMDAYLHDAGIMQEFARDNREAILRAIVKNMGGKIKERISSVHNYIDMEHRILRKGSISARKGEVLVIPLNMRDGLLICEGKGNDEWNQSAPHGAGRLYSRSRAKEIFSVSDYKREMEGIFTTCIGASTIDEAPFAYKDYREIMECIQPTVEIRQRLVPIYNFKASE